MRSSRMNLKSCSCCCPNTLAQPLIGKAMEPVIQEELTGCGIAACATLAGVSYAEAQQKANALGIYATDTTLCVTNRARSDITS